MKDQKPEYEKPLLTLFETDTNVVATSLPNSNETPRVPFVFD